MAAGILVSCEYRRLNVPNNLALIGFDNQPIFMMMKITTIEMNLINIGQNLFLQAMNEQVERKKEIGVHLIERGTVYFVLADMSTGTLAKQHDII
ncbi:substrate-binding domain-containing protein [Guptibacillus hwajinpoensis]|uniref:substrate-binding domain-containing protein n=1 Tax=Guptibacillus hwajinpoensis TaxID=208199 RepID=UPI0034E4B44A